MWVLLWGGIVVFIIGFAVWSFRVQWAQISTWKDFARKNGMNARSAGIMKTPVLEGNLRGFVVSLQSGYVETADVVGQKLISVIEIEFPSGLPTAGGLGSFEHQDLIVGLDMPDRVVPDISGWNASNLIRTIDKTVLNHYLNEERLKALMTLFKAVQELHGSVLFLFDEQNAVLRIETNHPLHEPRKLERTVNGILGVSDVLLARKEDFEIPKIPTPEERPSDSETNPPESDKPVS